VAWQEASIGIADGWTPIFLNGAGHLGTVFCSCVVPVKFPKRILPPCVLHLYYTLL
jgi:hypothetical protein